MLWIHKRTVFEHPNHIFKLTGKAIIITVRSKKSKYLHLCINFIYREPSGSVVECLTRDREAASSSLTDATALS